MKKGILAGFATFLILLAVLFAGMVIGGNFFDFGRVEEKEEEEKKEYEPVLDHERAVIEVVEKNIPAVVSIVATRYVEDIRVPFRELFLLPEDYEERERLETEHGTGFIISQDGLILTNRHVVGDEGAEYTVFLSTGEMVEAEVLVRDPVQDLAVLKIEKEDLPTVAIGDSDTVRPGQTAIAIGNALGEFDDTVSVGVISGTGRRVVARGRVGTEVLHDVIQTDAAINLGNSGGPLLNLEGEVIGINTATAMHAEGIGFAIPVNRAKRAVEAAREGKEIAYPFLGVRYVMVDSEVKRERNLPVDYGALIISGGPGEEAVYYGSAADSAGLREGDILLEFDEEKLTKENHLATVITRYYPGDEVDLKVLRGDKEKEMRITLGEMPD